jgi:hypothetical protein
MSKVPLDDWAKLLSYYTLICNALKEIERLNVINLFNNQQNLKIIIEYLPSAEIQEWLNESLAVDPVQHAMLMQKFWFWILAALAGCVYDVVVGPLQ